MPTPLAQASWRARGGGAVVLVERERAAAGVEREDPDRELAGGQLVGELLPRRGQRKHRAAPHEDRQRAQVRGVPQRGDESGAPGAAP